MSENAIGVENVALPQFGSPSRPHATAGRMPGMSERQTNRAILGVIVVAGVVVLAEWQRHRQESLSLTILVPALAVAFAASCVWLAVRIINRRERWAKRTLAAMVGVPILYVASFGPICWALDRHWLPAKFVAWIYYPCVMAAFNRDTPRWAKDFLWWWATLTNQGSFAVHDMYATLVN
jgi:drug/metabolite transporter (DMT)-like permease